MLARANCCDFRFGSVFELLITYCSLRISDCFLSNNCLKIMRVFERQTIAKLVVQFYTNFAKFSKALTVKHFLPMGEKANTIYKILERYDRTGSPDFKPKTGRKRTVATPAVTRKVVRKLKNSNRSERETARELQIPKSTVHLIKKREGLRTGKCVKAPKMSEDQQKRCKTNARKVLTQSAHKILILDDETYVPADPSDITQNRHFNYIDKNSVPNEVRFRGISKFPKQYLVWQAIDECGHLSEPYIKIGTMKADEYLEECIIKRRFLLSENTINYLKLYYGRIWHRSIMIKMS